MIPVQGGTFRAILRNPKLIPVVVMGLTVAFGVLYIVQVNTASTKGFATRDLEKGNQELRQDNDRLAAEIDRLRSLSSVEERETFLGLVKVNDVTYLKAGSNEVALK
jgi:hypothetical protein